MTATDINNCGSCGHACNSAGGEACVGGTCTCTTGTDCSGICTTTSDDPNNCGGCGIKCGMPTSAAIDSGLIGHWQLDEGSGTTSVDSSGNGNTATLSGATWTDGYSGEAVAGNGSSTYVSANLGLSTFGTNSALTASAWVYATATTNGPVFGVTSLPVGGGWNMPFLSIAGATAYGWLWGVPGTNSNTSPLAATVSLNAWHFLTDHLRPVRRIGNREVLRRRRAGRHRERRLSALGPRRHLVDHHPGRQADRRSPTASSTARSTRCAPTAAR